MGGYARTGPFVNGSSPGISATFLNNVEAVLARPSGDTETGKYFIDTSAYANATHMACYIPSLSRTSVPVSATVDTSDNLSNCGGVSTSNLTANGLRVGGTAAGPNLGVAAAGNYTINY